MKKINGMLNHKEIFESSKEDWNTIEPPLKLFFEKTFESKLIQQTE